MLNSLQQIKFNHNYPHKPKVKSKNAEHNAVPIRELAPCQKPYCLNFGKSAPNQKFTDFLSDYIFENSEDIAEYIKKDKSSFNGIAGDVPPEWAEKINCLEKKEKLFNSLKKFSTKIQEAYKENPSLQIGRAKMCEYDNNLKTHFPDAWKSEQKAFADLNRSFPKLGLLKFTRKLNGEHGIVYLIDNKYALKIFRKPNYRRTSEYNQKFKHGNAFEQNRAFFIKKQLQNPEERKTADIYFADLQTGYMLSEHAGAAAKRVFGEKSPDNVDSIEYKKDLMNNLSEKLGLYINDYKAKGNIVNGILVDYGFITKADFQYLSNR